jgi:hypothetical protein
MATRNHVTSDAGTTGRSAATRRAVLAIALLTPVFLAILGTVRYAANAETQKHLAASRPPLPTTTAPPPGEVFNRIWKESRMVAAADLHLSEAELVREAESGQNAVAVVARDHHINPDKLVADLVGAADTKIEAARRAGQVNAEQAESYRGRVPDLARRYVYDKPDGRRGVEDLSGAGTSTTAPNPPGQPSGTRPPTPATTAVGPHPGTAPTGTASPPVTPPAGTVPGTPPPAIG